MSQEDLALEADMDQSMLSKLERLGPSAMSYRYLCKLAAAMGCVVEINFRRVE